MFTKTISMSMVAAFSALSALSPSTAGAPVSAVMKHLDAFQSIADRYGNRAAGTAGYEASLEYVRGVLEEAGIETKTEEFSYDRWVSKQNELTLLTEPEETAGTIPVRGAPATPAGGVTGSLEAPETGWGCEVEDWGAVETGYVALVETWHGECEPEDQARVAAELGAAAVVLYIPEDGILPYLVEPGSVSIPMINGEGNAMRGWKDRVVDQEPQVNVRSEAINETVTSSNLLADINIDSGDEEVAMFGAHLDGVSAGPGINDNASGVAALLATALDVSTDAEAPPTRLGFWGGEEDGLKGSFAYVDSLSAGEKARISEYSNLDMVASPNYIINVRAGDGSISNAPTDRLRDYFDGVGQPHIAEGPFGSSDFQAFADQGIPTLDYSTGASWRKTAEQVEQFGGVEGEPFDPNYHQASDDVSHINADALEILLPALCQLMRTS